MGGGRAAGGRPPAGAGAGLPAAGADDLVAGGHLTNPVWPGPARAAVRAALLAWYEGHRRDLPWRQTDDPYAVWVSEVMLQQTRVATVVPYYRRWLEAFPTVADLAAASLDDVLRLWQGLGYYARARHLHRAAQVVVREHGGRLPPAAVDLRRLPGIGDYAAGAIASIAFGQAVPAVDGNVTRVLARLAAIEGDPSAPVAKRKVVTAAASLVDGEAPGAVNQALMELGATVCTPAAPACGLCPLAAWCAARAAGRQADLPARSPRSPPRSEHRYAYAVRGPDQGPWLVGRRPAAGLLGGLWEFPMVLADPEVDPVGLAAAALALPLTAAARLPPLKHVFTHIRLVATPIVATIEGETMPRDEDYTAWRWVSPAELEALPASRLMGKLVVAVGATGRAEPQLGTSLPSQGSALPGLPSTKRVPRDT